jgi:altronate dehydratase
MEILGYLRPDGQVGIRNKVAVIYTVHCSMFVASKIQQMFPENTQLFGIPQGCGLRDGPLHKIVQLGKHSQFGAALVVGLGCEGTEAHMVGELIAQSGKPVEVVKINEEGGDIKTIEKGSRAMVKLIQHTSMAERAELKLSDLVVGAECGGSDATSGLASNPIVGAAADLIIDNGGTYMHEEVSELLGCGEVLAARSVNAEVAADIKAMIAQAEEASFAHGRFSWGYGNILGGLTSIEEKSYGCLAKSGTKPLQGVLHTFQKPPHPGYWIMVGEPDSGTFSGDPEGINRFGACGAQIGLFTTGCGSTTGGLIPVIKVLANTRRMQLIADNADLDATPVIRGEKSIEQMGAELYQEILAVAAGKLTKSEIHRHYEA